MYPEMYPWSISRYIDRLQDFRYPGSRECIPRVDHQLLGQYPTLCRKPVRAEPLLRGSVGHAGGRSHLGESPILCAELIALSPFAGLPVDFRDRQED